jgi:hypothetical protein
MDSIRTKWDHLLKEYNEALQKATELAAQMNGMEATPCGLTCSGCGTVLETEADFAKHFTVKRIDQINNHWNLGECPERMK